MALALLTCAIVWLTGFAGCVKTVYVKPGEPVRLREDVKDVAVWVQGEDGEWIAGRVDLSNGWYALPDPGPPSEQNLTKKGE